MSEKLTKRKAEESSDEDIEIKKKSKKDKKDKKDKKKKDKKSKKESEEELFEKHPRFSKSLEDGKSKKRVKCDNSDSESEKAKKKQKIASDTDSQFNDEGEFVKGKNKDMKELIFGNHKKEHKTADDPTINFLNGQKYSEKYYNLLETRKILPAW